MFASPELETSFISRRSPLLSKRGMVASSQPLASEAGLQILRSGGNAADACVAMAAVLNVCEPCSTGIGGDAFALWFDASTKTVSSLQGNGRSPSALTLDLVTRERGHTTALPPFDALTVTVPGAAAAWVDTVEKWGTLPLEQVLQPGIELAQGGWPVPPVTAGCWKQGEAQLKGGGPHGKDLLIDGERAPRAGEVMYNPHLANTFKDLACLGKAGFYGGRIGGAIVDAVQRERGVLVLEDLQGHVSAWDDPISTLYRNEVRVWEVPPPTQGLAALSALNILEAYYPHHTQTQSEGGSEGVMPEWGSVEHQHVLIECMRLGFSDSLSLVCDPHHTQVPIEGLLDKARADKLAQRIREGGGRAGEVGSVDMESLRVGNDTVYFNAVDKWGNACSFINSNYMGFGTGIVPEGCGFTLQNRGHGFSLSPQHPNCLAPLKRPYHTIIPGMTTYHSSGGEHPLKGDLHSVFGVMGGFMQPQGHMQVISNMVDYHMDPQTALDKPRFNITGIPCSERGHCASALKASHVALEAGAGREEVAQGLRERGHDVKVVKGFDRLMFGKGQIIVRDSGSGVLWGGSEGRADGCAMGF